MKEELSWVNYALILFLLAIVVYSVIRIVHLLAGC